MGTLASTWRRSGTTLVPTGTERLGQDQYLLDGFAGKGIVAVSACAVVLILSQSLTVGVLLAVALAGMFAVRSWGLPSRRVLLDYADLAALEHLDASLSAAQGGERIDTYELGLLVEERNNLVRLRSSEQISREVFERGTAQILAAFDALASRDAQDCTLGPELQYAVRLKEESHRVARRLME